MLWIICSKSSHAMLVREIGRQFSTLLLSDFLKRGVIIPSFHSSGTTPWSREAWKSMAKTSASKDAQILRSLPGIWSGPVALRRIHALGWFWELFLLKQWSICNLQVVHVVGRICGSEILYKIARWKGLLSSLGQWPRLCPLKKICNSSLFVSLVFYVGPKFFVSFVFHD